MRTTPASGSLHSALHQDAAAHIRRPSGGGRMSLSQTQGHGTTRPLVERIDYFLAEREAVNEHQSDLTERLARGETVLMGGAPVASIEDGWALLREAAEALRDS